MSRTDVLVLIHKFLAAWELLYCRAVFLVQVKDVGRVDEASNCHLKEVAFLVERLLDVCLTCLTMQVAADICRLQRHEVKFLFGLHDR